MCLLSSCTLFRALRSDGAFAPWALHSLTTFLFAYTHHYAMFSIGGQLIFLIVYFLSRSQSLRYLVSSRTVRACAFSYLIVFLGWALWLPVVIKQLYQVHEDWWADELGAWALANRCFEMFFDGVAPRPIALICATFVAAVVGVLLWRGAAAERYIATMIIVPYVTGAVLSFGLNRNVFVIRYLLFAHVFLLIGMATLVARIQDKAIKYLLASILIFNGVFEYVDFQVKSDLANSPGMRAAVEYIKTHRSATEPVIVSSSFLFFPALYYAQNDMPCRVYSDGTPFPHHLGGPVIIDSDIISSSELRQLNARRVWVICHDVPPSFSIPESWKLKDQKTFAEPFRAHTEETVAIYDVGTTNAVEQSERN